MDIKQYLKRINYQGDTHASLQTLQQLQLAHMLHVPFENLDIHLDRPILLDYGRLYNKVVQQNRGGFCYELNGLFAELLRRLGFQVDQLSARVHGSNGKLGPDFDHMLLLVHLDESYMVDVGFGDSFQTPFPFKATLHEEKSGTYRVLANESEHVLMRKNDQGAWQDQYRFTLEPRAFHEYEAMCHYQQSSPNSSFTQKTVCSRATPSGRVTISNQRLILTENGHKSESPIENEAMLSQLLKEHFQIDLSNDPKHPALMRVQPR